jgi:hypothetical protein
MQQNKHAEAMVTRFRELVEDAGDSLSVNHYNELKLIIEAGLDTALLEAMEKVALQLDDVSHDIRHNASFFD